MKNIIIKCILLTMNSIIWSEPTNHWKIIFKAINTQTQETRHFREAFDVDDFEMAIKQANELAQKNNFDRVVFLKKVYVKGSENLACTDKLHSQ